MRMYVVFRNHCFLSTMKSPYSEDEDTLGGWKVGKKGPQKTHRILFHSKSLFNTSILFPSPSGHVSFHPLVASWSFLSVLHVSGTYVRYDFFRSFLQSSTTNGFTACPDQTGSSRPDREAGTTISFKKFCCMQMQVLCFYFLFFLFVLKMFIYYQFWFKYQKYVVVNYVRYFSSRLQN